MYTRLSHKRTKKYYREIVDLAIEETQKLLEISPEIAMYRSILNQLIDIKHTIIEQCKVFFCDGFVSQIFVRTYCSEEF